MFFIAGAAASVVFGPRMEKYTGIGKWRIEQKRIEEMEREEKTWKEKRREEKRREEKRWKD